MSQPYSLVEYYAIRVVCYIKCFECHPLSIARTIITIYTSKSLLESLIIFYCYCCATDMPVMFSEFRQGGGL